MEYSAVFCVARRRSVSVTSPECFISFPQVPIPVMRPASDPVKDFYLSRGEHLVLLHVTVSKFCPYSLQTQLKKTDKFCSN
jgi:hypothetical protein